LLRYSCDRNLVGGAEGLRANSDIRVAKTPVV